MGQIHLFCWGGRWQTGSKMAAWGGGGGVDSDLFGRGGGVCFSHVLFIIFIFILISLIISVELQF